MKVRIVKDGRVINNAMYDIRKGLVTGFLEDSEKYIVLPVSEVLTIPKDDKTNQILPDYWEQRRYEIVKDYICSRSGFIAGAYERDIYDEIDEAISIADILIEKLKEKNNGEQ